MNLVVNTIAIMDRKDLLAGVNPAISFLIKTLLSRPAYIGLEAECHLTHGDHTIHGYGMMEYMLFRSKSPPQDEDKSIIDMNSFRMA